MMIVLARLISGSGLFRISSTSAGVNPPQRFTERNHGDARRVRGTDGRFLCGKNEGIEIDARERDAI
jgi:hypothetical protein